jgi:IMP dehydrogenase
MLRIREEALTFDDVLLLPRYSEVTARDVCLTTRLTRKLQINIPLVSAAMDTVTEARLAIAMAQEGGIGIIHKSMSIADQASQVLAVKKHESGIVKDPITIQADASIRDLLELKSRFQISGVPVLRGADLVGIVTNRDVRYQQDLDAPVSSIMTPKERLVTVGESPDPEQREEAAARSPHREGAGGGRQVQPAGDDYRKGYPQGPNLSECQQGQPGAAAGGGFGGNEC